MKALSQVLNGDEAAKNKAFGDGLYFGGQRYVLARVDDRSLYARSVSRNYPCS
jgi:profilin